HLIALRRTLVEPFSIEGAVTLDDLEAAASAGEPALAGLLLPVAASLGGLIAFAVGDGDAVRLLRGQAGPIRGRDGAIVTGPAYATSRGRVSAVGRIEKGCLHPQRVFNYTAR